MAAIHPTRERIGYFAREISARLSGETDELSREPLGRLDWAGVGSLLHLYHATEGTDRSAIIGAFKRVLRTETNTRVLTDTVGFIASLDISQADSDIRKLAQKPIATQDPLKSSIEAYMGHREAIMMMSRRILGQS